MTIELCNLSITAYQADKPWACCHWELRHIPVTTRHAGKGVQLSQTTHRSPRIDSYPVAPGSGSVPYRKQAKVEYPRRAACNP